MRAVAFFQHQEAQNTGGGTATAGSWEDRKLTNVVSDLNSIVSLAPLTGIITLQPGSYLVDIRTPFNAVAHAQSRLVNAGTGAVLLLGSNAYTAAAGGFFNESRIIGVLTITTTTTVKVQSQVETSLATVGYGGPCNFTTEIYTTGSISVLG